MQRRCTATDLSSRDTADCSVIGAGAEDGSGNQPSQRSRQPVGAMNAGSLNRPLSRTARVRMASDLTISTSLSMRALSSLASPVPALGSSKSLRLGSTITSAEAV